MLPAWPLACCLVAGVNIGQQISSRGSCGAVRWLGNGEEHCRQICGSGQCTVRGYESHWEELDSRGWCGLELYCRCEWTMGTCVILGVEGKVFGLVLGVGEVFGSGGGGVGLHCRWYLAPSTHLKIIFLLQAKATRTTGTFGYELDKILFVLQTLLSLKLDQGPAKTRER